MARSFHRGVVCSTMLICRAVFEPKVATAWCEVARNNMHTNTGRSMFRPTTAAVTLRMRSSSPRPSPRWGVGGTPRNFLQKHKSAHFLFSSVRAGGGSVLAAGDSSSLPLPKWNNLNDNSTCPPTSVPLDEYIALGPRYRQQRQPKQQGQGLAKNGSTATRSTSIFGDHSNSSYSNMEKEWLAVSCDLAASLGIDPPTSTEAQHRRVFHLYLPVYFWLKQLLVVSHRRRGSMLSPSSSPPGNSATTAVTPVAEPKCSSSNNSGYGRENDKPVVVGISAPQGCGKTTLVSEMQRMLEKAGHSCAVVSIDDFYLTGAEQDDLAASYPTNQLLQVRGNAGTHDLALGLRTIRDLTRGGNSASSSSSSEVHRPSGLASTIRGVDRGDELEEGEGVVRIPRYDKSARGGKGDRAPEGEWGIVKTPVDIVLLEGWMLGFEALPDDSPLLRAAADEAEEDKIRGLGEVNTFLRDYQELHDEVDAWLVLKTSEPEMVFEWRAEAERRMREAGRPGMSEDQVRDFCSRYMPAYRAYLPGLYNNCVRAASLVKVEPGVGGDREQHRSGDDDAGDVATGATTNPRDCTIGVGDVEEMLVIEVGRDRNPVL